jgi:ABC-2 type transport system ATP-binding protein
MTVPIIQTSNLTKSYARGKFALEHLDLSVEKGEIFGYLGPNGAGKTTTIKLLLDLIRPTAGSATIFGMDTQKSSVEIHRRIGFLPGELNLWDNLTSRQVVNYIGQIRGGVDWNYVNQLAEQLAFDLSKTIRSYSTGNKRKLGLILALMNKPELLILDEPTSGLDPLMQQTFNQLMLGVKAEGRTVFLSSHILSEVQAICDRVGILRDGKLQTVESVNHLVHVNFQWVTLRFNEAVSAARFESVPGVSDVTAQDGNAVRLRLTGDFDPLLRAARDLYIVNVTTENPSLEEIFLTFYSGTKANNGSKVNSVNGTAKAGVR